MLFLKESTIITEASFKETIVNVCKSIGKVIVKIITFVKNKVIGFFKFVGKFFEKIYKAITKSKNKNEEDNFDFYEDFDEEFSKDFKTVEKFYDDKEVQDMESAKVKQAINDLEDTKKDVANNIKSRHDEFDEFIKNACEQIVETNKEINKSFDNIADTVKNEPDNEAVKILKSFLDDSSSRTKEKENIKKFVKKFYAYNPTLHFLRSITDFLDAVGYEYDSAIKKCRRELDKNLLPPDEQIKKIVNKYVAIYKKGLDIIKDCFEESKEDGAYESEELSKAKDFLKESKSCLDTINMMEKYCDGLKELKEGIDELGQDLEVYTDLPKVKLQAPLYNTALSYYTEALSGCNYVIKQHMTMMKHNIVEGMKFVLYIKKSSMPAKKSN